MESSDNIGNVLSRFYSLYGRPQEGPPENLDITNIIHGQSQIQGDITLLQQICDDTKVYRDFVRCRDLVEDIAVRLSESSKFVEELDKVLTEIDINENYLTNGIFWYTLASSLDPSGSKQSHAELLLPKEIPLPFRHMLQLQGSLIFRLFISLVYMKESIIQDILQQGNSSKLPTLILCRQLLNCEYIRHLRNALSHADFDTNVGGIVFRDNEVWYGATPAFLDWLCIWVFTIHTSVFLFYKKGATNKDSALINLGMESADWSRLINIGEEFIIISPMHFNKIHSHIGIFQPVFIRLKAFFL